MDRAERLTVTYDEREDRLRLAVQDGAGRTLALWLTQRLAGRLATALLARLERAMAHLPDDRTRSALQAWEQSAAQAQHAPSPPVAPGPDVEHRLLTSIDLTLADDRYQLVLRWDPERCVLLQMNRVELRQWLRILHQLYRQAEWPCGVWPGWFEAEAHAQPAEPGRSVTTH